MSIGNPKGQPCSAFFFLSYFFHRKFFLRPLPEGCVLAHEVLWAEDYRPLSQEGYVPPALTPLTYGYG